MALRIEPALLPYLVIAHQVTYLARPTRVEVLRTSSQNHLHFHTTVVPFHLTMTDLINCEGGVLHCFMPELVNSHDTHDSEITFWALAGILTIIASSFLCSKADERNSNNFHILAALGQISALAFLQQGRLVQPVDTPISNAVLKSLLSLIAAMWALSRLLAGIQKISAAFIAKRTVLWKLFHVRNGTYETAVRKLHEQYGDVVQVGPYELSISNAAYFERCARFEKVGFAAWLGRELPLTVFVGHTVTSADAGSYGPLAFLARRRSSHGQRVPLRTGHPSVQPQAVR